MFYHLFVLDPFRTIDFFGVMMMFHRSLSCYTSSNYSKSSDVFIVCRCRHGSILRDSVQHQTPQRSATTCALSIHYFLHGHRPYALHLLSRRLVVSSHVNQRDLTLDSRGYFDPKPFLFGLQAMKSLLVSRCPRVNNLI